MSYLDTLREQSQELSEKIHRQREEYIEKALAVHGYFFEDREEMLEFMKEKCELYHFVNSKIYILKAEGKDILSWSDLSGFRQFGNTFQWVIDYTIRIL